MCKRAPGKGPPQLPPYISFCASQSRAAAVEGEGKGEVGGKGGKKHGKCQPLLT